MEGVKDQVIGSQGPSHWESKNLMSKPTYFHFIVSFDINYSSQSRAVLDAQDTKVLFVMCSDGSGTGTSGSQTKTSLSYTPDASISHIEGSTKSYTTAEENVNGNGMSEPVQEHVVTQQKGTAKIHDFCFGIPFGGLVLSGGLAGFVFTRNLTTLINGVLFGGALLALSTFSLKVWRQGKSSFPFILGQAVLAAALLLKNFQTYSMTKKMFPTGFYIVISAAMICFYAYVVMSGGNPPPKKLRSSVAVES